MTRLRELAWTITIVVGALSACSQDSQRPFTLASASFERSAPAAPATAQVAAIPRTLEGRVVGIADGDTITVLDSNNRQTRIRLQGIDAPESGQAFGQVSKQNLADLVFGKVVVVQFEKTDRYGRTVGKVLVNGRDVCLEQIRKGLGWHYKQFENEQTPEDRKLYSEAEQQARSARRGLWFDPDPIPPWDYRRGKRGVSEGGSITSGDIAPTLPPTPSTARRPTEASVEPSAEPRSEIVYITRTGSKYHRAGCRYLSRSQIPVRLKDVRGSYEACKVCRPPQ